MHSTGCRVVLGVLLAALSSMGAGHPAVKEWTGGGAGGDAVTGREVYVNICMLCHGIDGKGVRGTQLVPSPADLTSLAVQSRLDGALFRRIHDGKSNTGMGAWKQALSDEEIWDVLAYVRTLRIESPDQTER